MTGVFMGLDMARGLMEYFENSESAGVLILMLHIVANLVSIHPNLQLL